MAEQGSIAALREQAHYRATATPRFIDVPEQTFLMIDGSGDPNTSPEYREAVAALYSLSYALKFHLKKTAGLDYRVGPLEGLWWVEDMTQFSVERKSSWLWTMMIVQPAAVSQALLDAMRQEVRRKKPLPALDRVRLESFAEGRVAQVLHRGPYSEEGPTIERLHQFIREHGAQLTGRHHEIYLSDPARTAPERLKTILRQPVA